MAKGLRSNPDQLSTVERRGTGQAAPDSVPSSSPASYPLSSLTGADDLKAIEALAGTSGLLAKTAANAWALRQIALDAAFAAIASVTNPAGVAGNPTLELDVQNANRVLAGPGSGSPAQPTFRALVDADIPAAIARDAEVAAAYQPLDSDLTEIAALSPSNDDVLQRKSGAWTNRTIAQLLADLGYVVGTFTPTFTFDTPGDLSVSYATQTGAYVKFGSLYFVSVVLVCTPTHTTASGTARIGGLPATVLNGSNFYSQPSISSAVTYPTSRTETWVEFSNNRTDCRLLSAGTGQAGSAWGTGQFPTATARNIQFSGFFST